MQTSPPDRSKLSFSADTTKEKSQQEDALAFKAPTCEISHISFARWKELQDGSVTHPDFPFLTVAPKGKAESNLKTRVMGAQSDAATSPSKTLVEALPASKSSTEKPYRLMLNGGAELMGVLSTLFNEPPYAPGYYIWLWPFKYLIDYGEKLRARLSEEELKIEQAQEILALSNLSKPQTNSKAISQDLEYRNAELNGETALNSCVNTNGFMNVIQSEAECSISKATDEDANYVAVEPAGVNGEPFPDYDTEPSTRLRDELSCLVEFMDKDMKTIFDVQKGLKDGTRKNIEFDYLWQLFKPGELVVTSGNQKRAYVVLHVTGGRALYKSSPPVSEDGFLSSREREEKETYLAKYSKNTPFVIDCFYVDFDATGFGPIPKKFLLQDYDGEVPITSLEVFPARFDESSKDITKQLIKRGKRFVKFSREGHRSYAGHTINMPGMVETRDEVNGDIIIDFALAYKYFEWNVKFGLGVIMNPTAPDERELKECYNICPVTNCTKCKRTFFMDAGEYDNALRTAFLEQTSLINYRAANEVLPDEILRLLPPRVYGFSLLNRKWYAFDIDYVGNIENSDQSFDHLVLPSKHKKIMSALVQNHTRGSPATNADDDFSMDLIRGKGKGLIILLHGVPGVGKTSTAESVAAQTRRPLFSITCGDIGTTASQVEKCLNNYFDMAHKWGCVLLLDEADVFLAKREKGGDLERNGIVSVFLRVLEYYSGILILTTNRIGQFDEAFSSRVHIKLYYPKLDEKSTIKIWKMNLKRIRAQLDLDVEDNKIIKFAKQQWAETEEKQTQRWNGRQIKNAFQTPIALARWDHQEAFRDGDNQRACLSVKQFKIVAETSAHFDDYISMMYGVDVGDTWDVIAAREFLRKNENPRNFAKRSGTLAPSPRSLRRNAKVEVPDDDDDDDDDDSDENEEKIKELEEKMKELKRRRKVKDVVNGKKGDVLERGSGKVVLNDVKDAEESSDSSD